MSAGAVAGITSVLLVMLMSQPRIFFAMSRDGLLPKGVSKVHPRFGTPYITTIITCVVVAIVAGLTQIQVVGEMTSIGTLFAFVVVCAAVLVLRIQAPRGASAVPGARRVPVPGAGHPVVPVADAEPAGADLGPLPGVARHRHPDLLVLRPHPQPAGQSRRAGRPQSGTLAAGNFLTMLGWLTLFNGFCMTLLAYMTEFGVTTEVTAKWAEIGVTPREADARRAAGAGRRRGGVGDWPRAGPQQRHGNAGLPRDRPTTALQGPRLAISLLGIIIAGGTLGYVLIEGWSVWDGLYMAVTTVATVGFREVHPLSRAGPGLHAAADRGRRRDGVLFRNPAGHPRRGGRPAATIRRAPPEAHA